MYSTIIQNKNIRYYLIGGGVSRLGDVLSGMAFLFLAYDLTGSAIHTTGMAIAETVPYLLFGLIGGVIADWLPRKRLLIILDCIRIPLVFSVVLFHHFNIMSYAYLLLVSFLIQSIGCFFNPAHRAVLPLITKPSDRTAVNSLNDTVGRGVTVLSPIISVWLLSYGVIYFFVLDALTYFASVFCLTRLYFTEHNMQTEKSVSHVFLAIKEFFIWLKGQQTLKCLFILTFIVVFFNTWVWEVGLLLALTDMTSRSEEVYSILQGVFGVTVIVTNIFVPYFVKKMTIRIYLVGAAFWGTGILYYGVLYDVEHFFIGAILVGIGLPVSSLVRVYLIQSLVSENKLGRAFSSNAVLLYLANTISLTIFGLLASIISIQWLMISSGALILLTGFCGLLIPIMKHSKSGWRFPINFFK
ncbi:MFS transporter [Virgibacillus phasianinus]|uniref:MFS transporter n=1 Tax=Virgibacillus phasianinus TaxID=2017483 RepID=A0A220TZ99_9BACI|nr:MFS transporter [Virgibacillus phasianinus]ASK61006.1 MFS transporter [Virgibacillus phasianinus]